LARRAAALDLQFVSASVFVVLLKNGPFPVSQPAQTGGESKWRGCRAFDIVTTGRAILLAQSYRDCLRGDHGHVVLDDTAGAGRASEQVDREKR
jgi:hypothetical protein